MTRFFSSLAIALGLAASLWTNSFAAESDRHVTLGVVDLSFYSVVGSIVQETLENRGYTVDRVEGPHAEIFPKLGRGEIHLMTAAWLPNGHAGLYEPIKEQVVRLAPLYDGAAFFWAVPSYVPESEIGSIADLPRADIAERMEKRIVSLPEETGLTVGGRRVMSAYGLDSAGYELVAAAPADWMANMRTAIADERWVVIPLWQPLWINAAFDIRRLEEPQGVYGEPDTAYLVAHETLDSVLDEDTRSVLSNIRLSVADVTEMDASVNVDGLTPTEAARQWMQRNPDKVAAWTQR